MSASEQWHYDEELGLWLRNTIHQMGRRCHNWDYLGTGSYLITINQADRGRPLLGKLVGTCADDARIELSELGRQIEEQCHRIGEITPAIAVLRVQLMPEHLHLVLQVRRRLSRHLGTILRGFKGTCSKLCWKLYGVEENRAPLFEAGFVDTILFDAQSLDNALAYAADNPRRLWEKLAHPECFTVLRDLTCRLHLGHECAAHFTAIGNRHLLDAPVRLQVQCSRKDFAYQRGTDGILLKEAPPAIRTEHFQAKYDALLAAAQHGAVLVSPCISQGEKEIARLACAAGHSVIVLANKGFSPRFKPAGKYFDQCAAGKLLMLAPSEWPYLPGEKKITRTDACILNRLAQAIAGPNALEIRYQGFVPHELDALAMKAVRAKPLPRPPA